MRLCAPQDNDSLAVLVAEAMQAEILLLFSDVSGIYTKAPVPGETPEVLPVCTRATPVNFGAKSTRGRGGMQVTPPSPKKRARCSLRTRCRQSRSTPRGRHTVPRAG